MLFIDNYVIDEDIFSEKFACNLTACKGVCCVAGDAGAPVASDEVGIMEEIYPKVAPFLNDAGRAAIEEQGAVIRGEEDGYETPLIDGKECAYVVFKNDIALCGIEQAYRAGAVDFPKPVSCHLYPIRVHQRNGLERLRYDVWPICSPACDNGRQKGVRVYEFLQEAITRRFGPEFYAQLTELAKQFNASTKR